MDEGEDEYPIYQESLPRRRPSSLLRRRPGDWKMEKHGAVQFPDPAAVALPKENTEEPSWQQAEISRNFGPDTCPQCVTQRNNGRNRARQCRRAAKMSVDARHFPWHYSELDDKNFQLHDRSLLLVLLLLLAVVLLVVLCFYFRRPCRLRASAAAPATAGGCATMEAAARRLPVRVRGKEEAAACSICLSMVTQGEKESVLPGCDHGFHPECIHEWLRKQSSCPLCRAMVVNEIENLAPAAEDVPAAVV
ncbi:RING-H2 finger protein ATL20 [Platanthera guangdongensis]|uniref:RING-H2 finger protein ATL20 n=1 Tax=Platanthera guangdongensis TaxID=2320717 RepID=A0ABR2M0Z5_9ASPA